MSFYDRIKEYASATKELEKTNDIIKVIEARVNPNAFVEYVIKDRTSGQYIVQAPIHIEFQNAIDEYARLIFGIPREHGKTTQLIGRALFEIGQNPDIAIKIVSADDTLAGKRVNAIKNYIEFDKRFKKVFPSIIPYKGDWGKTSFKVIRSVIDPNPTVDAAGVLTSGAGDRCDLLLLDDPVNMRNAIQQPALREQVYDAITNIWFNLLSPNGRIVWIGTPWHMADAMRLVMENSRFKSIERYVDAIFTPVWKERWGKEALMNKREEIRDRAFSRGFQGKVLSDDEQVFGKLDKFRDYDLSLDDVEDMNGFNVCGVDLAISEKTTGAYTVIFGMKVDDDGNKAPINIVRKRMTSKATVAWLLAMWNKYNYDIIVVEANAYQAALIEWIDFFHSTLRQYIKKEKDEWIVNKKDLQTFYNNVLAEDITSEDWEMLKPYLLKGALGFPNVESFVTGKNKADLTIGIPGFASEMRSGNWVIPSKGCEVDCDCNICNWVKEMEDYPVAKFKDVLMASWFANSAVEAMGLTIREI